jgi:hypothetical protein
MVANIIFVVKDTHRPIDAMLNISTFAPKTDVDTTVPEALCIDSAVVFE